jgi:hypothetical protein
MATPTDHAGLTGSTAFRTMAAGAPADALADWVAELAELAESQTAEIPGGPQGLAAWTPRVLWFPQLDTVATLAELIIPTTDTPGGRAAQVDRFVDYTLASASIAARAQFTAGLAWLDERSRTLFGQPFTRATPAQQTDLLTRLAAPDAALREGQIGASFFTAIKTLTISGYYSSEIGLRQELGDSGALMLPRFEGCDHPEHQG